ncbi:hypothetical protein MP228_013167 [Amoeboaphelidium protococcarum]|nr:hypothetical protein MP228_013167 [Amoeboaphelidium protococcarum]
MNLVDVVYQDLLMKKCNSIEQIQINSKMDAFLIDRDGLRVCVVPVLVDDTWSIDWLNEIFRDIIQNEKDQRISEQQMWIAAVEMDGTVLYLKVSSGIDQQQR